MPTVSTYGPRKVSLDVLPGVRKTAAETPTSEGVGVQEAKAQTDQAIGNLGGVAAQHGVGLFAQAQAEERQRADQTALLEAQNTLSRWQQQRLYDPETGALTVKGKDAMPLPEQVGGEFDKVANDVEATLKTDTQRQAFRRIRSNEALNLDLTLRRHVYGEMQTYEQGELKAFVENSTNDAIASALDPRRIGDSLNAVTAAIQTHGPRLGLGPEQIKQAVGAAQSQIHVGVIDQLLSTDHVAAANAYFEETKDQISGDAIARVEKALEVGTLTGEAQKQSDAIIQAGGTLTQQREKVRAIDDPKLRDEVMQRVEHESALTDRAQRENEEADAQQATQIVEKTGRFDAIPAPLLARLPLSTRSSLRSYAMAKARGIPVETDLPTYYELMNQAGNTPETFITQNLLDYRGKLDDPEFKQLAGLQLSLRNGDRNKVDKELAGFRTKSEIVDDTLTQYGIDPKAKPTSAEGQAIATLRRMLDRRVDAAQADGKKITNDEIQSTLDGLLGQQTTVPGSWWNIFPGGQPFMDTTKRLIATTPADIPADERKQIDDALRRAGRPVTDATALDLYLEAQVRRGARAR